MAQEEIVVVGPIPGELRARLSAKHHLVALDETGDQAGGDLGRFRIAVTMSVTGMDVATMDRLPGLGMIACNGVGLDRIDLDAAAARGIAVRNTPGVLAEDVADAAIGLMFAIARRQVEADRFVRAGRWGAEKMPLSTRIAGARIGIVGMGSIGRAIARRAAGLGMTVAYATPSVKADLPYAHIADPVELARASDIVILACPGGPATRGLAGAAFLDALGPRGFLVNVARGQVVDEAALLDALEGKQIGGAALDVFIDEPAVNPRFLALDNVVLQPHYAGLTTETRADIAAMLDRAIDAFLGNVQ